MERVEHMILEFLKRCVFVLGAFCFDGEALGFPQMVID